MCTRLAILDLQHLIFLKELCCWDKVVSREFPMTMAFFCYLCFFLCDKMSHCFHKSDVHKFKCTSSVYSLTKISRV